MVLRSVNRLFRKSIKIPCCIVEPRYVLVKQYQFCFLLVFKSIICCLLEACKSISRHSLFCRVVMISCFQTLCLLIKTSKKPDALFPNMHSSWITVMLSRTKMMHTFRNNVQLCLSQQHVFFTEEHALQSKLLVGFVKHHKVLVRHRMLWFGKQHNIS